MHVTPLETTTLNLVRFNNQSLHWNVEVEEGVMHVYRRVCLNLHFH